MWVEFPMVAGWYWVRYEYSPGKITTIILYIDENNTYDSPVEWDDERREHIDNLDKHLFYGPLIEPK